jgi:hypothetical protein
VYLKLCIYICFVLFTYIFFQSAAEIERLLTEQQLLLLQIKSAKQKGGRTPPYCTARASSPARFALFAPPLAPEPTSPHSATPRAWVGATPHALALLYLPGHKTAVSPTLASRHMTPNLWTAVGDVETRGQREGGGCALTSATTRCDCALEQSC